MAQGDRNGIEALSLNQMSARLSSPSSVLSHNEIVNRRSLTLTSQIALVCQIACLFESYPEL